MRHGDTLKRWLRHVGLPNASRGATQQGRLDFFELDAQPLLSRGARNPEAQSRRYDQRRQANGQSPSDKERTTKEEEKFFEPHLRPLALAGNETG